MDEPGSLNPLLQPPQQQQQQEQQEQQQPKKKKKTKAQQRREANAAYREKMKWKEPEPGTIVMPPRRDARPVRESAKINFSAYMVNKGYYSHEIAAVGDNCRQLITVLEDICPRPLRLAPYNYPKQYLLKEEHVPLVRDFLMRRNTHGIRRVQEVVWVDGYALVLCSNESAVEYVRGLLPEMAAEDMGLKEIGRASVNEFNRTRGERCDFNILIKYRNHGFKRRQQARQALEAQQRAQAKAETAAAASSGPNIAPFDPSVPPPPLPRIFPG